VRSLLCSFSRALADALTLCLVGLKKGRYRRFWARMRIFLSEEVQLCEPSIPVIRASKLFCDPANVELRHVPGRDGNVSSEELTVLALGASRVSKGVILEIGTYDGRTTLNLAVNAPDAQIFTLDLPREDAGTTELPVESHEVKYIDKPVSGNLFQNDSTSDRITQLLGDSATFDFSEFIGKCGLVFVDGSHSYEYVLSDARRCLPLLRPDGGLLFFHDYGTKWWDGVTRALNELHASDPEFSGLRLIEGTTLVVLLPDSRS